MSIPISENTTGPTNGSSTSKAYDAYLLTGFLAILCLILGFVAWSIFAPIQGAIIAPGSVVVEGKPKTLQHLDGGIVGEILVQDGDLVKAGDIVIRLDATSLNANQELLIKRLNEARALQARLQSESEGRARISWDTVFSQDTSTPEIDKIIKDQSRLFQTRRKGSTGEVNQLRKRIQQSGQQISGMNSQILAGKKQLMFIGGELSNLKELLKDGYVSQSRILVLEREKASLDGQIANLQSQIARTRNIISETEIQILQVSRSLDESVLTELRSTESLVNDLEEQLISASDQAGRVDIIAPVSGTVHNMSITTIGGVVTPANPIMDIIPDTGSFIVDAQVEPASIDQIYVTQPTTVRLSAFNQRTTPELNGEVKSISANTLIDPVTGMAYYSVKIVIPPAELGRLKGLKLVPGMPAESFMQTDERSAINYLLKPATDQLNRAFREE